MNTNFINIIKEENSMINTCFTLIRTITMKIKRLQACLQYYAPPQPDTPRLVAQDERIELRRRTHSKRSSVTVQSTVILIGKPNY